MEGPSAGPFSEGFSDHSCADVAETGVGAGDAVLNSPKLLKGEVMSMLQRALLVETSKLSPDSDPGLCCDELSSCFIALSGEIRQEEVDVLELDFFTLLAWSSVGGKEAAEGLVLGCQPAAGIGADRAAEGAPPYSNGVAWALAFTAWTMPVCT